MHKTINLKKNQLAFLKICFYVSIIGMASSFLISLKFVKNLEEAKSNLFFYYFSLVVFLPVLFIWLSSWYYYLKFDRYSGAWWKLLLFSWLYGLIYFYKVMWKHKRPLKFKAAHAPLLGNTIHIETEEED